MPDLDRAGRPDMPDLGRGAGASRADPQEPAWSMAAAGTSELWGAPAGSSEDGYSCDCA